MSHRATSTTITTAILLLLALGITPTASASGPAVVQGTVAAASRGFPSVVLLKPAGGSPEVPADDPPTMHQQDKTFVPGMLIAAVGQPIVFQNDEGLLHNVHVYDLDTDETILNVAQPVAGWTTEHVFDKPGPYVILCDVHPEMEAYIYASNTPHAVVANEDGSFSIEDVPAGEYTLVVWNIEQSKHREEQVSVPTSGLEISR